MIGCRIYRRGDAASINRLYFEITGRERTIEQFEWQWQQSPAGPGDIWVIYDTVDGEETIVGHHGVMPIRFTQGSKVLLFGKTENTMLLTSYRERVVYPRLERRFKAEYEKRYDALFSTIGPAAAMRVRLSSGYKMVGTWRNRIIVGRSHSQGLALLTHWLHRCRWKRGTADLSEEPYDVTRVRNLLIGKGLLTGFVSEQTDFFAGFWEEAKHRHGVSPSREAIDLHWRFWRNPYKQHFTFIKQWADGTTGYAIISLKTRTQLVANLEDVAVSDGSQKTYSRILSELMELCAECGVFGLSIRMNSEEIPTALESAIGASESWLLRRFGSLTMRREKRGMARFITDQGRAKGIGIENWELTPIIFEGR